MHAENKWIILNSMFKELGLVRQHLDSFNDFIEPGLQEVLQEQGTIVLDDPSMFVRLDRITISEPKIREADGSESELFPLEARIRDLTYASKLRLRLTSMSKNPEDADEPPKEIETLEVFIGYLPIMLKSNKCPLSQMNYQELIRAGEDPKDPGGYFIVNGSERVLVTQEDLAPNRILIESHSKGSVSSLAKVFSTFRGFRAPVTLERLKDGNLRVSFPSVSRKIPLVILLRALGLERDDNIAKSIGGNDNDLHTVLIPILQSETEVTNREEALDFIGKRVAVGQTREYRISRTESVLDKYLLPHIGSDPESRLNKAYFLCLMAQRVLELELGKRESDDKDHYSNKRLNLAGDLLMLLFRNAFKSLCRDIKYQLERSAGRGRTPNVRTAVRADVVTERLRHAMATGNWVGGKAGVSQLLDRTNYMSTLSHLRRVVSPLSRSQPHFEARDLHPTHWGKI
ncbi:MAG: DNA-directed RNA polymerase subunit B'', partial [Candidatus Heimdallarchaeota archaeon]|nr:DNA-directed RNA polymerase subunit B'' [Candidatus Heimdallarchaeota archaeon]MCK5049868.1 DNA-directed RNA polymerase subunit B'' [Candidatus Heimdallarchaeota archaeon]